MKLSFSIFPRKYGLFPYIFLVYFGFPIYYLTKESGVKQLAGYGMVLLFLLTYRQLYFLMEKKAFSYWLAVQLIIVFILSVFYSLNHIFLGFFPANFIGWYRDKKVFKRGLFSLAFVEIVPFIYHVVRTEQFFTPKELLYFVPFLIIMLISPFGIRSMNRRMELEQELERANQRIEELVKREERVRIARDLHDTLGHTLSLLTLKSQLVQRLIPVDSERARSEAKEMEVTSRAALKQVRELVTDMRAIAITEELLEVQQILRAADITYQYDGDIDFSNIPPFTQNIISMCLKEAATNVVKHSRATHCSISINLSAEKLKAMVRDDGMGVPLSTVAFGNGLKGMEERLALIDGSVLLRNQNGAVLEINVPIIKKEAAAV
ncbi:sensor histidine kinase [Neobacillus rhizophilus]|uniref:histidine kinase n=1 Tax=Neobacillus rhizophilus TaxID=2833579 RepID=A0A942U637_9BACI|nr:sensor histidine kinase [Neobacillus rhizophilus]MBS4213101.1 sensor histidine kinase [Neobacillus rhizophilus]MBU8914776.1 sensor histidine kinase [Bacillus sp. FJAT-29953]